MSACPCRRCRRARSPYAAAFFSFGSYTTDEERLADLKRRFVTQVAKWGETWLDAEWLENELDELFGLKHARWQAEQEREKEVRRARVDRIRETFLGRHA